MTDLSSGTYGAKIQSWQESNPRNTLARIRAQNPNATETELADVFWREVQSDEDSLKVIVLSYWFPNTLRSLVGQQQPAAPKGKAAAKIKRAIKAGIRNEAQRILLDIVMPNGKALRDCTGKDCAKVGGWLTKVAGKLKPDEVVGKVLSEAQVRKLYGR